MIAFWFLAKNFQQSGNQKNQQKSIKFCLDSRVIFGAVHESDEIIFSIQEGSDPGRYQGYCWFVGEDFGKIFSDGFIKIQKFFKCQLASSQCRVPSADPTWEFFGPISLLLFDSADLFPPAGKQITTK